jgi:hypothetical protein
MTTLRRAVGAALLGSSMLIAGGAVSQSFAGPTARLVSPGSYGTVDFGDRVPFRLAGSGCAVETVRVSVSQPHRATVWSPRSRALPDPLALGECEGVVTVPSERQVRASGWDEGDDLTIELVSPAGRVPLRYQRLEVEHGKAVVTGDPVLGGPKVVTPASKDPRGGPRDKAVELNTGDVLSLGRVDLTRVFAVTLRVCIPVTKPHVGPSYLEIRTNRPDGPALVGPVDVADDYPTSPPQKANFGWPNCWQSQPWPITGARHGRAPELFLAVKASAVPVHVSYIDLNGTGAKLPDIAPTDPRGFTRIFDGTSFTGWDHTNCTLEDGAVRNTPNPSPDGYGSVLPTGFIVGGPAGCSMTYTKRKLHNVVLRMEFTMSDYEDNGAVMVGGNEIQMRQAGEWMTGGVSGDAITAGPFSQLAPEQLYSVKDFSGGGFPALRLKTNSPGDWNQMEIVQLGARRIVRLNGRTVTDCAACVPDSGPYSFSFSTQPNDSWYVDGSVRMDSVYTPTVTQPSDWGNMQYRNVRVYDCRSLTDPLCTGGLTTKG